MSSNELARQREVDIYRIADSLPESAYDDIVQIASVLCDAPMALVTVIDRDRQWFKSKLGLDAGGTRRDEAFCDHAIRAPDSLFEVNDASTDERFADNPLVTGELGIRFYAGMPLVTPGGAAIGTVCVLDRQPRSLDESQRAALSALARVTMNLLEGRQQQQVQALEAVLECAVAADDAPGCTVAIFQLQEVTASAARIGERAVERALQQLELALEGALAGSPADCVNRVSGSHEAIAVLNGDDPAATLRRLQECVAAFEREHGLHVLCGAAVAVGRDESIALTYQRADEALSLAKDAWRASR